MYVREHISNFHWRRVNFSLLFFVCLHIFFAILGFFNSSSKPDANFIDIENSPHVYFFNNFMYSLILMSGMISFGLITVFLLSLNAFILGEAINNALLLGNDVTFVIYNLLHGLIELPALYFFYMIGITPLIVSIKYVLLDGYRFNFYNEIKRVIKYFTYGTLLLLIAAVIEYLI